MKGFITAAAISLVVAAPAMAAPADKTTGGGKFDSLAAADDVLVTMTAQGTPTSAKGNFDYRRNSDGLTFKGDVTCYSQSGNRAAFSGPVIAGNATQGYFLTEVNDGGNGPNVDTIRVRLFDTPPSCVLSGVFPGFVFKGNLTVH
jgi:hypothetical protein